MVTGRDIRRAGPLLALLQAEGVKTEVYSIPSEPTLAMVTEGAAQARSSGCDLVVSFGGGSAIDAGKAIAAMITNTGDLLDHVEIIGRGQPLVAAPAPCIAIPTTAGTGTEVTRNAVLLSPEHRVKVSLRSPLMLPRVALVDPGLTLGLPPALTATTGLDALTQVIEPYVSCRANPMMDALCVDGIRRAARSLRLAFSDGSIRQAREDMALTSLFGGLALANAGLGAVHGFAAPIGGMAPAPHGAVCAALLAPVIRVNSAALTARAPDSPVLARYDEVARLLTGDRAATREDAARWVEALVRDLEIPKLGTFGVGKEDVETLVSKAAQASSMKGNPLPLSEQELRSILESAI